MSLLALLLVIAAAFIHAGWNLLAKRLADDGFQGAPVIFSTSASAAVLYAPAAVWLLRYDLAHLGAHAWLALLASAIIHYGYMNVLQRGYRAGDLSVVYPLARGSGPLLASLAAIILLGERPGPLALTGIALIICGVLAIAGADLLLRRGTLQKSVGWGLLTGLFIATYTMVDGYSVKVLLIAPLLVDYTSNVLRTGLAAPAAWVQRATLCTLWRRHLKLLLGIAVLSPLSYILFLTAMKSAPISHIAPAREMSMMVAAWLGTRLLGEGAQLRRLLASSLIVSGVVALMLG